ncbi:MAG: CRISPR-associated endonuclease Cas1 [Rhodospirillaceae bacterium]|nr:CRISPR-associated endonuclease Cas1 [Rhodospirillaceae bacterium]
MTWRIVDLTQDGRHLHTQGRWIVVKDGQGEVGRVPLVDVQSVIAHAEYATYSHDLFRKLAECGIPFVVCDRKHNPVAVLLPLSNHHLHAGRAQAQARASLPVRKRIWRDLVKAKIAEQSRTLAEFGLPGASALKSLCGHVRSGDPDNVEARAARIY